MSLRLLFMYKIGSLDDIFTDLREDAPLAVDTETIGKYGRVRPAQFYQEHWDKVLLVDKPDPIQFIATLAKLKDVELVFQFSSYDITTIQQQTGSRFVPNRFEDTFYLARLAYPQAESFSLDNLMTIVLGFDPYAKHRINKAKMQKSDWSAMVLTDEQLVYASIDVLYLLDVYNQVSQFKEDINYKLDMHNVRKALNFQNNGMPVEIDEVENQFVSNLAELKELNVPVNVNSWQQVRPYVDAEGSDALTLAKLAIFGNERAEKVLLARRLKKQNSFLNKFNTDDQRVYGKFAPSARSGRYTCSDQNLQQLPRKLKHCFGVKPDSGRVLLYADYPQLELRTIAAITVERVLIELFKNNGDPHGYVAEGIFGPQWTKDDRQIVKTYNFNLLYCGGAGMIQSIFIKDHNIYREIEKIRKEVRRWKQAWPAIKRWQEECIRSHRRGSLKQTPFGRRYRGKLLTDHANIENQGFGADVAKLALHYMFDDLVENDAKLCNFVHDSFIVEMDADEEANHRVAKLMREAMMEAWTEACKMVTVKDIPMPAQVHCGYNWGRIEQGEVLFTEG